MEWLRLVSAKSHAAAVRESLDLLPLVFHTKPERIESQTLDFTREQIHAVRSTVSWHRGLTVTPCVCHITNSRLYGCRVGAS